MTKLEALKTAFERINIEKGKKTKMKIGRKDENEMMEPGKKKERQGKQQKKIKKELKKKKLI